MNVYTVGYNVWLRAMVAASLFAATVALLNISAAHASPRHRHHHADRYCHINTAAGPITIACHMAEQMRGFIADVVARGFRGPVHCLSHARSHVRHSLHFKAEACDFAQHGWGKTHRVMYHVGDLTAKWGLRNGCSFGDCGHVDSGRIRTARR